MIESPIVGPCITLEGLSFHTGKQTLLKDINCHFESGKWYGIVGPNGGGKSTLLKTILGLNNHLGTIHIHWPKAKAGNIGYIPQLIPFDDSLPISVRDYLLMSLSSKPIWFRRHLPNEVNVALSQIQLVDKLERRIGDLSGGERQRLMLTTALLQKPSLLILDEPMTGLDTDGRKESLALLSQFKEAGGTLLMIEHDWDLIQKHCDQVFWVEQTLKTVDLSKIRSYTMGSTKLPEEAFRDITTSGESAALSESSADKDAFEAQQS